MGLLKQEAAGFEPGRATSIHYLLGINAPSVSTLRPKSKEGVMAAKKGWGTIFFLHTRRWIKKIKLPKKKI